MSEVQPSEFDFDVEDIGQFRATLRSAGKEVLIQRKIRELCGCNPDDAGTDLRTLATIMADLSVLLVAQPPGWAVNNEGVPKLMMIYSAFQVAERRFQGGNPAITQVNS